MYDKCSWGEEGDVNRSSLIVFVQILLIPFFEVFNTLIQCLLNHFFPPFFILKKIESATCLKQESGARLGKVVASFPHREHHRLHRIFVRTCNREGEKRKKRRQGEECELVCKCDKFLMFREETGVGGIEILRRYDDSKNKRKEWG